MERPIDIKNFFLKNKLITILFLFSTTFFLYQHSLGVHWDFASYSLNAEYIFSDGNYFEWYRAPLASFLIGIFTFFILPFWLAEYIYIIFVSSLFLYSCVKFSKSFNLDKTLFYVLMLNPFVVLVGLAVGTELLGLAFLLLFFSYLFPQKYSSKIKSGISFAFAILARYSVLPYSILIFFTKNLKKNKKQILLFFVVVGLVFFPWFLFNYYETGHILTSIANSQALNIKYRDYLFQSPSLSDFLLAGNILILFFFLGLRKSRFSRENLAMIIFLLLTILFYIYTPVKVARYLFNVILPLAYFSYFYLKEREHSQIIFSALTMVFIVGFVALSLFHPIMYLNSPKEEIYELGKQRCMWASNQWVPLNYIGYHSEATPYKQELPHYINQGYRIIVFYGYKPDYLRNTTFLRSFPIIKETPRYIILGGAQKCKEFMKVDKPYLYNLNKSLSYVRGHSVETNPCKSLGLGIVCDYFNFL